MALSTTISSLKIILREVIKFNKKIVKTKRVIKVMIDQDMIGGKVKKISKVPSRQGIFIKAAIFILYKDITDDMLNNIKELKNVM